MTFSRPSDEASMSHEAWVAREAQRLKWRREKAAQRRKARHDGFFDEETVEPPRPTSPKLCSVEGCDRSHKARGLCEAHYKASRRGAGKAN